MSGKINSSENPPTKRRYISTKKAAAMLDLAPQTLHNWRQLSKNLPYRKFGRTVKYLEEDVLRFAESRVVEPVNIDDDVRCGDEC